MASNHTSLDAAATERKARLAKLASLKRKQPSGDDESGSTLGQDINSQRTDSTKDTSAHLSGRNYDRETRGPRLGFENIPSDGKDTLELRAKSIADEAHANAQKDEREEKPLDLFTLQPKKPNWDLKRDLATKTDILDQRTDNAIARLVRERVEGQTHKRGGKTGPNADSLTNPDSTGLTGSDLVEGIRMREKEEANEERRLAMEQAIDDDDDLRRSATSP